MNSKDLVEAREKVEVAILHEDGELRFVDLVRPLKALRRARRYNHVAKRDGLKSIAVIVVRS